MSGLVWLWADRFPNRSELLPSLRHQRSISIVVLAPAAPRHVCLVLKLPHSLQHKCKPRLLFLNLQEPQGLLCFTSAKPGKEGTKRTKRAIIIIITVVGFTVILQREQTSLAIPKRSRKKAHASGPTKCFAFPQQLLPDDSKTPQSTGPDGDAPYRVGVPMALERWHPLTEGRRVLVVSPMTGIEETLCLGVRCRKTGIILFTCLLRSRL